LEKVAGDLFIFTDELQAASNLTEADIKFTSVDFEELAQPSLVGPFVGFRDPRRIIGGLAKRIQQ